MEKPDVHEMSLVEGIVALVEDERRKQAFARVRVIRLKLGALGHVEPEALRFCFDAVTNGSIADGARLDIEMVPGEGWCSGCRRTVPLAERFAACPLCGNAPVRMTAGDELRVAEMEVE
jgi:hydrogenase nickel incorporation protein HypA/HybF